MHNVCNYLYLFYIYVALFYLYRFLGSIFAYIYITIVTITYNDLNVAFKARKLSDSIMESQDSFIMQQEGESLHMYLGTYEVGRA